MSRSALLGATALSLTIGFGGSAVLAAHLNGPIQPNHGVVKLPPAGGKAIVLSATVNADGSFVHGVGATGSTTFGTGLYEVDFNRDVTACSYVGSIGNAGSGTAPPAIFTDAGRSGNPNGVWVDIWNPGGTAHQNSNFHLVVACPKL